MKTNIEKLIMELTLITGNKAFNRDKFENPFETTEGEILTLIEFEFDEVTYRLFHSLLVYEFEDYQETFYLYSHRKQEYLIEYSQTDLYTVMEYIKEAILLEKNYYAF